MQLAPAQLVELIATDRAALASRKTGFLTPSFDNSKWPKDPVALSQQLSRELRQKWSSDGKST